MKTIKFTLTSLAVVAAFGLTFFLSKCKKDVVYVVVQVHDTLKGKSISGLCTYPNYSAAMVKSPGAVVYLYLGSTMSGNPVATAYADTNGNYTLPYLLPNTYYLYAQYNTDNNYKAIEGINFHTDGTDPTYAVTLGSSNIIKDLALATEAPTGTKIITITASDTTGTLGAKDCLGGLETHSQCDWQTEYAGDAWTGAVAGTSFHGGFRQANTGFFLTTFYFDEATPANTAIKGFVLLSKIVTFQPIRDSLYSGCVPKTLLVDTSGNSIATCLPVPITDTAWYYAPAGSVIKYGKGYLAHGSMTAFYHSAAGEIEPPRTYTCSIDSGSWNGKGPSYLGPYSTRITKQIDFYFEYQGANIAWNATHTTFNKWAVFEGQMDWYRRDFFVKSTSVANKIRVTPHIQFKGPNNKNW